MSQSLKSGCLTIVITQMQKTIKESPKVAEKELNACKSQNKNDPKVSKKQKSYQ